MAGLGPAIHGIGQPPYAAEDQPPWMAGSSPAMTRDRCATTIRTAPVTRPDAPIGTIQARAYTIPTDSPEADGTFAWEATTLIVVEVAGGGRTGLGYTYADASNTSLIETTLAKAVQGIDALDPSKAWAAMQHAVRNLGHAGLAATAISALDAALWDLKAKLLDLPLASLLGRVRDAVPIYGSGGFTTYSDDRLREQLSGWVERDGCGAVKMKVGTDSTLR